MFLHKAFYTPPSFKKRFALSIAESFRNILFLQHFYQFSQQMRCTIVEINTNLLIIQRNINIFTGGTFYPSFIFKKIGALHRKHFSKHPLFTTFSLFLTVNEFAIFQINADFLINQLEKYFYTTHLTLFLHSNKKICTLHRRSFLKN